MLSPNNASKQAGVSRRTIMVAIESFKLKASRNNRNHWKIKPDDLRQWMDQRDTPPSRIGDTISGTSTGQVSQDLELLIQIKGLEVDLKGTQDRLDDVKEDRDHWRKQAQELARKRRWWHF